YIKHTANLQKEVFMPLQFEPGEEAQVDWHDGWIYDNEVERKVQCFVMKLSYSKAPFVYPYQKANLESFLDGHVRAFEYFGGVPQRIAYDNLKCAVIKVLKGKKRRLNKRFKELRAWYLFDTRFCNIAKGNEKGDVENCCKRSERTYLSPQPHVDGIDQLASKLFDDCQNDLKRKGPTVHGGKTIGELFEEDVSVVAKKKDGSVILSKDMKTMSNGFIELWLPRDLEIDLTIVYKDMKSGGTITTNSDSKTCITTFQLK
ncbi:hypothetical protein LCGC14_3060870, partial [marine sediment metagenome]